MCPIPTKGMRLVLFCLWQLQRFFQSSADGASTRAREAESARADHLTFVNTQPQAQRHRSTADLAVLDVRLADQGHLVKKRGKGAEVSEKCPWNLGLQFQRGLSDGDWDLEERATKKSGRAEAVSVYKPGFPIWL